MRGSVHSTLRRSVALGVCTLLCAISLMLPGAWAQSPSQHQTQEASVSDASVSSVHEQGDPSDQKPENPSNTAGAEVSPDSSKTAGLGAAVGDTFQYPLTIGDTQVPCWFYVVSINPNEVALGSTKKSADDPIYYEAAVPTSVSGAVVLPEIVPYEGENYTLSVIGSSAFYGCSSLTTTGLEHNSLIKKVEYAAFRFCSSLISTGLDYSESAVTLLDDNAFGYCAALTSTGLEHNEKIKTINSGAFGCCSGLLTTGLETNDTIVSLGSHSFDYCTSLKSTGLENPQSVVTSIDETAFNGCSNLISTGLENNHTVQTLGEGAFMNCTSLGSVDTDEANAKDLRLNGANGQLSIGSNAFLNTAFERIYFAPDLTNPTLAPGALDVAQGQKIPTLFVQNVSAWTDRDTFSFGTTIYSKSDGSLIIMNPEVTSLSSERVVGTSDSVVLTFTANHGFVVSLTKADNTSLGDYELDLAEAEDGQMKQVSCTIASGAGLTPAKEVLSAAITTFIYPRNAKAQSYNSFSGTSLSTQVAALSYEIAFSPNGGGGTMQNQQVVYGSGQVLSPCAFSVDNMLFYHWAEQENPNHDAPCYEEGISVDTLPGTQGTTLTLYAQWKIGLCIRSENAQGEGLAEAQYTLTTQDTGENIENVSFDQAGQEPITWPVTTDTSGTFSIFWLTPNTYILSNVCAPAGYTCAESQNIRICVKEAKACIEVQDIPVSTYSDYTGQITLQFQEAPTLPETGSISTALVQSTGVLVALLVGTVALRRIRRRYR